MTPRVYATVCVVMCGLMAGRPVAVAAQQPGDPARVSIGAAAGAAFPLHGDFDFNAWAWDTDARIALSRHTLFELSAGDWRHDANTVRLDVPAQGPSGLIGTFGRVEQSTEHVQRAVHASMLATGAFGRVRLFGGGGVGLLEYNRRHRTTIADCSPSVIDTCGTVETTHTRLSGSIQGSGGADIALTAAFSAYAQARFTIPTTDPGGAELRLVGGIRWGKY